MKKIILKIAGISLITLLALYSCQKEEVTRNVKTSNDTTENVLKSEVGHNMRYWYDDGDLNYGCDERKGNCYEETTVYGSLIPVIDKIGDEADNGNVFEVIELLKDNYKSLETYIPSDVLDSTIKGKRQLNVRGRLSKEGTAYLVFSNRNIIHSVYPLTK